MAPQESRQCQGGEANMDPPLLYDIFCYNGMNELCH